MDMYGFYTGRCFDAYEFLGCHPEGDGAVFRTFAPAAAAVSVILFTMGVLSRAWSAGTKAWAVLQGMAMAAAPHSSSSRAPDRSRSSTAPVSPERRAAVRSGIRVSLRIRAGMCS